MYRFWLLLFLTVSFCYSTYHVLHHKSSRTKPDLEFLMERPKSHKNSAIIITDFVFAYNMAIMTEEIHKARKVLGCLENEAKNFGLYCNAKKTEIQIFNHELAVDGKVHNEQSLRMKDNFKYLEAWTEKHH